MAHAPTLLDVLHQSRPFESLAQEAFVSLLKTADLLAAREEELLREHGVTFTQYNALRILRGAGPEGIACHELRTRLISRVPDVTRLLDRLERMGLVARRRDERDRRVVLAMLTDAGLMLVHRLDGPIAAHHLAGIGRLSDKKLRKLLKLLGTVRAANEARDDSA